MSTWPLRKDDTQIRTLKHQRYLKKYVSQRHFRCHSSALPVRVDDVSSRHDCGGDVRPGGVGAATEVVTSCTVAMTSQVTMNHVIQGGVLVL